MKWLKSKLPPRWPQAGGRWLVRSFANAALPAVIITGTGIMMNNYFAKSVELEAHVEKRDKNTYRISLTNIGTKAAEKGNGHLFIVFDGKIHEVLGEGSLPTGTVFTDKSKEVIRSCVGQETCRIVFGTLEPNASLNISFSTTGHLDAIPQILHGGKPPKKWSCLGLRQDLQRLC